MQSLDGKKAAVIGLGRMGIQHIRAYKALQTTISAAADSKEEARKLGEVESPGIPTYENWKELLEKETLDILSIATNGPSHAEIVIAAAEKHIPIIFCEKPMATNIADAERMISAAKENGSRLFINLTLRVFPAFERLLGILRKGEIGKIRHVFLSISGQRGLGCVGTHYLDLMRLIIGSEVERVWGRIDETGTPNTRGTRFRDPGGYGFYEFKNGARGVIEMSEDLTLRPFMVIIGSQGKALVDMATGKWGDRVGERIEIHKHINAGTSEPDLIQLPFEIEEGPDLALGTVLAIEDIISNTGKMGTSNDGMAALEMVMALHISDRKDQVIELPLSGADREYDVPMT